MKSLLLGLTLILSGAVAAAADLLPIERQVAEAVKSPKITIVHFWAPWCPHCYGELKKNGWSSFIDANPEVNFIFVTTWTGDNGDGRAVLAKLGVGPQKNFQLLLHPNASRRDEEKMTSFLGLPVNWLPATWIYRDGKLRYALNYGEVRFPMLQQMIKDTASKWDE
ncbi:TlpA family protein disulfide reductase [Horticoccus sp. 23ND18S-11]|uniref:TlpA family protein disulfide reductase n=1 Tax=Horticoccus sp. 23ND18S-11 TaxID=3391832 RepID=UPI0039C999EB